MSLSKSKLSWEVVELDELITSTIIELNKKGYYTKFCCSGHWYQNKPNTYIYFLDNCLPDIVPEGFIVQENQLLELDSKIQIMTINLISLLI